jgi:hypothetical protein
MTQRYGYYVEIDIVEIDIQYRYSISMSIIWNRRSNRSMDVDRWMLDVTVTNNTKSEVVCGFYVLCVLFLHPPLGNIAGRTRVPLRVTPFQPASAGVCAPPVVGVQRHRASSSLRCFIIALHGKRQGRSLSVTTDTYLFKSRETRSEDWILLRILFNVEERISKLSFRSFFNL